MIARRWLLSVALMVVACGGADRAAEPVCDTHPMCGFDPPLCAPDGARNWDPCAELAKTCATSVVFVDATCSCNCVGDGGAK